MIRANRLFRSRRLGLGLAFAAWALQLPSCSLTSLVVCFRTDRLPQFEFFSAFCSCRLQDAHSCADHDENASSSLKEACLDIPLPSHAILASLAGERNRCGGVARRIPEAALPAARPSFCSRSQAANNRGSPWESPPPSSVPFPDSRLRC